MKLKINFGIRTFTLLLFACCLALTTATSQDDVKTAAGLYNDGLAKLKAKDYAAGLPLLEQALAKAKEDGNDKVIDLAQKNGAMAAYNLGNGKLKAKALTEAMTFFKKGSELNPKYSSNFIGLARVLLAENKASEAMTGFLQAADVAKAEEKPKKVSEAHKRAKSILTSAYNKKTYDAVVTLGKQFLAKNNNSDVNYYVGKSQMEQNNHSESIQYFDNALASNPENKDRIYFAKATALEKLNQNAQAIEVYKLITEEKYKKTADYKIETLK